MDKNTTEAKDLYSREEKIKSELEVLFKSNLRETDYNVPEVDDQNASEILVEILQKKLDEIKKDVKEGKYKDY